LFIVTVTLILSLMHCSFVVQSKVKLITKSKTQTQTVSVKLKVKVKLIIY